MDTEKEQELREADEQELEQAGGGTSNGSGYVCKACGWTEYYPIQKNGRPMRKCTRSGRNRAHDGSRHGTEHSRKQGERHGREKKTGRAGI